MNWNLFKRSLFAFVITGMGILSMTQVSHAQLMLDVDPGDLAERLRTIDGICGDGTIDTGEQCDHGILNGAAGDLCNEECQYAIPEGQEDCVEQAFVDCYEPDLDLDRVREILSDRELVIGDIERRVVAEGPVAEEPPPGMSREDCVEQAILECTPEDEPETPEPQNPEEDKEQTADVTPVLFEGSGCTLGLGSAAANGWQILLGLGILFSLRRRR
jgi:hypothetical protein